MTDHTAAEARMQRLERIKEKKLQQLRSTLFELNMQFETLTHFKSDLQQGLQCAREVSQGDREEVPGAEQDALLHGVLREEMNVYLLKFQKTFTTVLCSNL